ncbi:MAG: two-component system, unclassified family, sensor histidine kinase and response regulator [Candidatus Magnetoglobus multicellularis str. Araruama]|uniref:Two-component system, unclassified family, sensor histidine kinase and response regulator n=1 Tax=Candidatus Magnetoglobus multicellularis str. Araruama TaxID=890399 RepID=A0A1V1P074_9BACT|nr:MAG: two-component system, unclassified family, sensor histidine kinase and response regulator [Candidatus Magnetoglobus multicellularis str. Araruama]
MNKQLPFKENILIVDDKPETLSVLTEILIEHGYNIRTALNVDIALKSACQYTPDLILMDVRMPGTDGFEACKMLKRIKQLQHVPVIFLTGATDINAKIAAFQSGGVDYITKPFANDEVLARIKTHLIIKQERERYQALAEATTEGILIHDNGVIVDINPAFETMMHCGKDIISKNIKTVFSTKSLKALSQLPKKTKNIVSLMNNYLMELL